MKEIRPIRPLLLVLHGPTACGKTSFAIRLAQHFGTHILSADSRQFYREMSIGTAKPTAEELAAAPHHFVGHLNVREHWSAGDYERAVLHKLEELFQKHELVILTGGSGLFIRAVTQGLDEFVPIEPAVREQLREQFEQDGLAPLLDELAQTDPDYYEQVDRQNPARVMRALEVIRSSGRAYSSFRRQTPKPRPFDVLELALQRSRELLYQRIDRRVDLMLAAGLEEEARSLYPLRELPSLQTVGYQEFFRYFDGTIDYPEAVRLIKRNSRRYAKRQFTWLRRIPDLLWVDPDDPEAAIARIEQYRSGHHDPRTIR